MLVSHTNANTLQVSDFQTDQLLHFRYILVLKTKPTIIQLQHTLTHSHGPQNILCPDLRSAGKMSHRKSSPAPFPPSVVFQLGKLVRD